MSDVALAAVAEELWNVVRNLFSNDYRPVVARKWVEILEKRGCDTPAGTQLGHDAGVLHSSYEEACLILAGLDLAFSEGIYGGGGHLSTDEAERLPVVEQVLLRRIRRVHPNLAKRFHHLYRETPYDEGELPVIERPRCDKTTRAQSREVSYAVLCDLEPGHGGKCHSNLYRRPASG